MEKGNLGISTGEGIYNYKNLDMKEWKAEKLTEFAAILKMKGLLRKPSL